MQRPAADVLNTARSKLTVWGAAGGAGQNGWKSSPSSALLEYMWSHAPHSKCQTQQAVAAQLRLCSTWNIRTTAWTEACPAATRWCSHCADCDSRWLQTHSACHPQVCIVTDVSGYVSHISGSFHCMCTAYVSAEVFHGSSLPQITFFQQWDNRNLAQLPLCFWNWDWTKASLVLLHGKG